MSYDIVRGETYGRLTPLTPTRKRGERHWICRCSCGNEAVVNERWLWQGKIKSCGCYLREMRAAGNIRRTHGMNNTPEHHSWCQMRARCNNPNNAAYANYGGRGISVHPDWQHDFSAFYAHVGPKPSPEYSLDRIDNDGNYEPGNVRWATRSEQATNTRVALRLMLDGRPATSRQVADALGMKLGTVAAQARRGIKSVSTSKEGAEK